MRFGTLAEIISEIIANEAQIVLEHSTTLLRFIDDCLINQREEKKNYRYYTYKISSLCMQHYFR